MQERKLTPCLIVSLAACQCLESEAAAFTVLEFNDTACKPKQGWREANGEGSKEGRKGGREEEELSDRLWTGFNYKNNTAYTDSESLRVVLWCFAQTHKRRMR